MALGSLVRTFGLLLIGLSNVPAALAQVKDAEEVLDASPAPDVLRSQALELVYASRIAGDSTFAGVELLEQAATLGDVEAQIALGDLYLFGTLIPPDRNKALGLYESAAEAGNGLGIHNYGMMLMWEERDPAVAEQMLVRAGEMGITKAWATLAEGAMYGYLSGGSRSRAKFDGYAALGRAAGVERIAVLEAIRHMWGISVQASGPRTLEVLQEAADLGNREAAIYLIRLVRDGNRYNIRRDRERAAELLTVYRPLLRDREAAQLELTIRVANATDVRSFEEIAQTLAQNPELISADFGIDLLSANSNAAIFFLQTKLRAMGYQTGPADGLAGARTVSAMYAACLEHLRPQLCEDSVLAPNVVSQLLLVVAHDGTQANGT